LASTQLNILMYFHVMESLESWELATWGQGGVIQFHQLLAAGVTRARIPQLVGAGRLIRLARGTYRLPMVDPWLGELRATILLAGSDAVAWRRTAAAWWSLDGVDRSRDIEIAVGVGGRRSDPRITRTRRRGSMEVTVERGLSVTAVGQTRADLGEVCGADVVERALEDALRRRLVDLGSLGTQVAGSSRGSSGVPVLPEVLGRRPPGAPPTESDAETLFLQLVRRAGIPEPIRQLPLVVDGRPIRLDFGWPACLLAVEIDGAATHSGDALGPDLRRQNGVFLGGWSMLRFTWEDVARYPEYVLRTLRAWWS
jgi:very-short-patch-repair endonuclease